MGVRVKQFDLLQRLQATGRATASLRKIKPHRDKRPNNRLPLSEDAMTCRSLLVLLDQGPQRAACSQAAIRLAKARDCPLERTTERFREECRTAGVRSFEATVEEDDMASSLVRNAHCSDLTLLIKADLAAPNRRKTQELVEHVVLYIARPTLILSYAGRFNTICTIGTNVMVSWDDSRAAAHALSDALPLLRLARHVQWVIWREEGVNGAKVLRARCDELRQWLVRHDVAADVAADVSIETTAIGVVDAMLSHAADLRTDLIVMGPYVATRSSHVQDRTTRDLLAAISVPVLFSH